MLGFELPGKHVLGQSLRQQRAISGDEPAGLGEPAVVADKIRPCQAIAIEKYDVVTVRCAERTIANFARAKAAMFVPNMSKGHAEPGLPFFDQGRGGRRRAVVRYEDLEVSILLTRKRTKYRRERVFAVVCGDNDGDQPAHRVVPVRPFSQAFM
jgi:hypothetical protein